MRGVARPPSRRFRITHAALAAGGPKIPPECRPRVDTGGALPLRCPVGKKPAGRPQFDGGRRQTPINPVKTNGGRRQKPPDLKTVAGFGAHLMRDMSIKARALAKSACSPPARLLAAGVAAWPLGPTVHLGPYDKCAGTEPLQETCSSTEVNRA